MFGNLAAAREYLTPEEDARYRAAYCGLCRSLRKRYGQSSGLTLNYDLCFLILLLQSLYEDQESAGKDPCLIHPFEPRPWWRCRYTEYAADMNIALGYLKLVDNWEDEGSLVSLGASAGLRSAYQRIRKDNPRQCQAMERSLKALHELERERREDPDAAAETFAGIMAEVFVYQEDRWAAWLRLFGAALGRFLYIMDAALDLEHDARKNNYNPFRRYYGLPDNESRFRDILNMFLGEALQYFDRLPLVEDVGILNNILCYGLWANFDQKYSAKKSKEE